ncbi:CRISPR-associated endonuclease Cas2 [Saccharibacillus brassicae]|uniref:CRISPR-associated endoribonuclease Cas2 n=1 Tax=Saccharibacillus brassicae TaxID=2583377 RepID=A0A4Y6URK7_SACBS|nr:CRISPR-associated endonuclease Cas2 [Saccharibacillus brassicae]QDH19684.1 CRISPR-associated endonuclease Cas2 [Saccharibacillus brassicae]
MLVLITYDVQTTSPDGAKRLRSISKICQNYGQRVQNSVFECLVDPLQFKQMKTQLEAVMNPQTDSLRYYMLGANWKRKVEHVGAKQSYDPEGLLLL